MDWNGSLRTFDSANAFKHGLRKAGQSFEQAAELSDQWLNTHVDNAQNAANRADSLYQFGIAFHLVSDETSPAHIGYQVWRGLLSSGCPEFALASWTLHALEESGMDYFHMGLAIAATQNLYSETYGLAALSRATGGILAGSSDDRVVKEIQRSFAPETIVSHNGVTRISHEAEANEAIYLYNLGLSRGRVFDYHHQSNHEAMHR